jgi:hypothetical protein
MSFLSLTPSAVKHFIGKMDMVLYYRIRRLAIYNKLSVLERGVVYNKM